MQHDYKGFPNRDRAHVIAALFPQNAEVITHRGDDLLMPVFSAERGISLTPSTSAPRIVTPTSEAVYRDLGTTWDIAKYAEPRQPVSLGLVGEQIRATFGRPLPTWAQHVLDMPIKFPGTDVRLPRELESIAPALRHIVQIDQQLVPDWHRYYAYLSVHQAEIKAGERMRENPYHVDGFQGPRWTKKHPVNRSYLLSDAVPTAFYPMSFPIDHLDLERDDVYAEFAHRIESAPDAPVWRARDFELTLMDAYCVHRSDVATQPVFRTWIRVSWETRIFDRLGNSHNPLFDYSWEMVNRDTDPRIRPRATA